MPALSRRLPPLPAPIREEWRRNAAIGRATLSDATLNLAIAACFVFGGWDRVVAPAFSTLRDSGGPYVWAVVFAAAAVWIVATLWWSAAAAARALRWGTVPVIVFGLMVFHSAVNDPAASFIGAVFAFYAAFQAVSRADLYAAVHKRLEVPRAGP